MEEAIRFASARGQCEVEYAAASLAAPTLGAVVSESLGIGVEHFAIHLDARLMFCACMVAHRHGDDVVLRIAQQALQIESALYGDEHYLQNLLARYQFASPLFHAAFLTVVGHRLIRMHLAERDAQEHLGYAKRILAKGAA